MSSGSNVTSLGTSVFSFSGVCVGSAGELCVFLGEAVTGNLLLLPRRGRHLVLFISCGKNLVLST